jgi:hypothetical protein
MAPEQLTALGLEWEQLRAVRRPFGRQRTSRTTRRLLIGLRVYVIVAVPLVTFAFLRALH